jgi:hypothetical protein
MNISRFRNYPLSFFFFPLSLIYSSSHAAHMSLHANTLPSGRRPRCRLGSRGLRCRCLHYWRTGRCPGPPHQLGVSTSPSSGGASIAPAWWLHRHSSQCAPPPPWPERCPGPPPQLPRHDVSTASAPEWPEPRHLNATTGGPWWAPPPPTPSPCTNVFVWNVVIFCEIYWNFSEFIVKCLKCRTVY